MLVAKGKRGADLFEARSILSQEPIGIQCRPEWKTPRIQTFSSRPRKKPSIHRQPEFRKAKKTDSGTSLLRRPPPTKGQQESMAALEKRSQNDPLTLIKK
jgi:hypothetical protein